ncbi:nucleotide exchange factor GrpE [Phytoactinopolyspora limicola]|uniref:nucleotide exchange factor GrpE n=1 Tax=Phytoactinopolyspora limicola TaxID=2715536 RepID=UPI00140AB91C|nr:nucleotide exchange factor GrpE [Phytoactinopolyspora limicola]
MGDLTPGAEERLDELAREVASLRDLFQRRLFDDRDRRRLYDELYDQLQWARDGLARQVVTPLLQELLLVVDRLGSDPADDFVRSIRDELVDVLERRGVVAIEPHGEPFDPAQHEATGTVELADGQPPGVVMAVERPGYVHGDRLLRPARVVVSRSGPPSP